LTRTGHPDSSHPNFAQEVKIDDKRYAMKVLITGITGMIGAHVAEATRLRGYETYGLARFSAASRLAALPDPRIFRCDILDRDMLENVYEQVKPDLVFHLAAQAYNGTSWEMEETTHRANYLGTLNILKATRKYAPQAKLLLACSSASYGNVTSRDIPLKEECPLKPITPYGVSKAATEALGYQYFSNYNMQIYLPRLFIHVGAGHPPATAIQNFARQLALIAKGKIEPVIKVGNLETARDFVDVRDGVRALMILLDKGQAGVPINICTGKALKISEILKMLIEISKLKVEIVTDKALFRLSDEPLLIGDNTRMKTLGWTPQYSMTETLSAVYQDWLSRIS
jgi:GDP-4-dehydro-6-deoxy-D-mannose reductase